MLNFFLFQAEDGIRDYKVTGVQTCALPILAEAARAIGFTQVSASHEVEPLIKLIGRGDTCVVDAYLSPVLRRYVDKVVAEIGRASCREGVEIKVETRA